MTEVNLNRMQACFYSEDSELHFLVYFNEVDMFIQIKKCSWSSSDTQERRFYNKLLNSL